MRLSPKRCRHDAGFSLDSIPRSCSLSSEWCWLWQVFVPAPLQHRSALCVVGWSSAEIQQFFLGPGKVTDFSVCSVFSSWMDGSEISHSSSDKLILKLRVDWFFWKLESDGLMKHHSWVSSTSGIPGYSVVLPHSELLHVLCFCLRFKILFLIPLPSECLLLSFLKCSV